MAVSEDVSKSNIRVENLMKIKNFSSLEKLLLVISYVLQYKNNCYQRLEKLGILTFQKSIELFSVK